MDQSSRKRAQGPAAPIGLGRPVREAVGVYAPGARQASASLAPAYSWPDWTDRVRYTVTRAWPDCRPGGES